MVDLASLQQFAVGPRHCAVVAENTDKFRQEFVTLPFGDWSASLPFLNLVRHDESGVCLKARGVFSNRPLARLHGQRIRLHRQIFTRSDGGEMIELRKP